MFAPPHTSVRWLRETGAALLSVVLPGGCRICERLLTKATRVPICDECIESFKRIDGLVCDTCGSPIEAAAGISGAGALGASELDEETFVCPVCVINEKQTYAFDRVRSWAAYDGAIVKAIILLKFEDIEPLGGLFASYLSEVIAREGAAFEADVIVPVPLHRQRERERGYNQAALIAKPLAKMLGVPYKSVLLTRIRPRPDKRLLSHEERWESVRGAFATRAGSQVDNLRVLLVDDVMTTGATLDSCAKVLREAGAKAVAGVTVARAVFRNAAERFR
jgi:competence protein ComFC